jgi:hypothetical protein
MRKSGMVRPEKKARRGRPPAGGRDPMVAIRMAKALIANADAWARANRTGRSEAIRRLVELGLSVKTATKQPSAARGARAKQLAAQAIEKMVDPTLHPDERAQRRRRLTKGPEEFRDVRIDRPKKTKGSWCSRSRVFGSWLLELSWWQLALSVLLSAGSTTTCRSIVQMWRKGQRHFLILLSQTEKQKLPNLLAEPGWSERVKPRWMVARETVFIPPWSIPETETA